MNSNEVYSCWIIDDSPIPIDFISNNNKIFVFFWNKLPKNYQKIISMVIVLFDSNNISDIDFKINDKQPSQITNKIITQAFIECYSN